MYCAMGGVHQAAGLGAEVLEFRWKMRGEGHRYTEKMHKTAKYAPPNDYKAATHQRQHVFIISNQVCETSHEGFRTVISQVIQYQH